MDSNKFPKSGRSRSVRGISTLPPKPRAEGSNPSAPAIDQGACKRLQFGVYRHFLCQNRPNGHALKIPDFCGKILQTPPIFVNIPTAAVWYIIKKASANFGKRTVLYRVPRMETLFQFSRSRSRCDSILTFILYYVIILLV